MYGYSVSVGETLTKFSLTNILLHDFDFCLYRERPKITIFVPTMDEQISAVRNASVPTSTARATTWTINLWKEWAESRQNLGSV